MTDPAPPTRWSAPAWLTLAVIAFGALLRWAALQHQQAISVDSVRYLTFAQNWLEGRYYTLGPTGLKEFPDLGYPLAISLLLPSASDPIRAAQWVSFLAGIGILILVYRIAHTCFGSLVAFYALLLACVSQPLLVASGQVLTESCYLFWTLLALDATFACLRHPGAGPGMLLGFACAMAYLTRGIGILVLPVSVGILWWYARRGEGSPEYIPPATEDPVEQAEALEAYQASLGRGGWPAVGAALTLMWLAIVAPYWSMLWATYGDFTLSDQAIWHVSGLTGSLEAHSDDIRLEGTLNESGTDYALNDWVAEGRPQTGSLNVGALVKRYAQNWVAIGYYVPEELLEPVTLILLTLGLFGGGGKPRLPRVSLALLWWLVPYVVLQPLFLTLGRYLLPAVPILLIWAGRGAVALHEWMIGRYLVRSPKATLADLAFVERVVFMVLFLLYTPGMIWPLTHLTPRYQNLELRAAGEWLAAHEAEGGIFASTGVAGYYANLQPNLVLPDAELPAILRLAAQKNVRYLVLDERKIPTTRPATLTALLYLDPAELPPSVQYLGDITKWNGYRVRILQIRSSGLAQAEVAQP